MSIISHPYALTGVLITQHKLLIATQSTSAILPHFHIKILYPHSVPPYISLHPFCVTLSCHLSNHQHPVPYGCVHNKKKWQQYPVERQRVSFLHMLRDTLLEKLRRSRSFGDLASLRPRPKSSLEVYVSVL